MPAVRRPWVAASFGLTLTLGAGAGAAYLLAGALGHPFPRDHLQLHGHTQVFGFVGLLATGLVEAMLPAGFGLAPRKMPRAAFPLLLAALLLRNLCQPFADLPVGRAGILLSAALLMAGHLAVIVFVAGVLKEGRTRPTSRALGLATRATTVYLAVAVGINALEALWLAAGNGTVLPRELTESFSDAALQGLLLAAAFTLGLRLAPSVGRTEVKHGLVDASLVVQAVGVALCLFSWLPVVPSTAALAAHDAGQALVAIAALVYLRATRLAARVDLPPVAEQSLRASDTAIRLSFGALGLWSLATFATILAARLTPLAARNPWWTDAARHLFTVGFVTLLVVGAAGRLSSFLLGRPLESVGLQRAAVGLVAGGALLRLLEFPALAWPGLYVAASVMGIPVFAGLVLLARNLALTARTPRGGS